MPESERGLQVVHSTNDRDVIAGAATMSLEIVDLSGGNVDLPALRRVVAGDL